jgi:hypothetical protein
MKVFIKLVGEISVGRTGRPQPLHHNAMKVFIKLEAEISVIFVFPDERPVFQTKLLLEILDLAKLFLFIRRDGLFVRLAEVDHHLRCSPVIPSLNGALDLVGGT